MRQKIFQMCLFRSVRDYFSKSYENRSENQTFLEQQLKVDPGRMGESQEGAQNINTISTNSVEAPNWVWNIEISLNQQRPET